VLSPDDKGEKTMPKPELEKIVPGDVFYRYRSTRESGPLNAAELPEYTVVKAARVWVTLENVHGHRTRMSKDTQAEDGGAYPSPATFYTLEQLAYLNREQAARQFLREAGIEFRIGRSRYHGDPVTLANLIRKHEGLPEL
jgi:hypothetical protein